MQLAAQRRKHSNVDHYVCHKPIGNRTTPARRVRPATPRRARPVSSRQPAE